MKPKSAKSRGDVLHRFQRHYFSRDEKQQRVTERGGWMDVCVGGDTQESEFTL